MSVTEWWARRARRRRVFFAYRPDYYLGLDALTLGHLFDMRKSRRIYDALVEARLYPRRRFLRPEPVSREDLLRVHTEAHLRRLRNPVYLAEAFNLPVVMPWDTDLMAPFFYQTGGTILAAERALDFGGLAVNLGGGFHHAGPEKAEGFCAVNDVAVAVRRLRAAGRARSAVIVDLDFHQGNGNTAIFAGDPDTRILSIQAENWMEARAENNRDVELGFEADDEKYLEAVRAHLPWAFEYEADIAFYVAGSDPWIEDRLGSWRVTRQGMLERDRMVMEAARRARTPLVIVGGGGYGDRSWTVYYQMCESILTDRWRARERWLAPEEGTPARASGTADG